jgi:hypothetical protein
MVSLTPELEWTVVATSVRVTDKAITVELDDGRTVTVPTAWYPRLVHATAAERARYEIDSVGVTWPDIDADFSIRGLLLGRKSGESPESFKFWLDARRKGKKVTLMDFVKAKRQLQKSTRITGLPTQNASRKAKRKKTA